MARSDEIAALAAELTGRKADDTALLALCRAAEAELERRLRRGVTADGCADCFVCAAALLAAAGCGAAGNTGVGAFRVGDVSVTPERAGAAALRAQALALMQPFLETGFSFLGVEA